MKRLSVQAVVFLLWGTFEPGSLVEESEYKSPEWTQRVWDGIQKIHIYYKYFKQVKNILDGVFGFDGCQFDCTNAGEKPSPRPNHIPSPNGCGTPLVGFQINTGIPPITSCCNQHDRCYATCGHKKRDCDEQFQFCLKNICRNLLNVLGLEQNVEVCETGVSLVFDAVTCLGCKPYLDAQRAACVCRHEDKADL